MKKQQIRPLELLAPAGNAEIAIEAIRHGADAVYIGPPSHGARKSASNTLEDIRRVTDFAHQFRARVYATVNTLVYEHELKEVERLVNDLYHAGADALIVQDMSLLEMDLPPIPLHASTQCDTRTPEKARFLQDVGFSQIVLARELTLDEIREICDSVSVPVECFIHGALCVSYSGRCHASLACMGRSANRGECSQMCRLPYTLTDANGRILAKDRHLLSLKDLNTLSDLDKLVAAGVTSFKIEGRLKEMSYVKNVVAAYRKQLDSIIEKNPDKYCRSSFGKTELTFDPQLSKSFNRGFTTYFLNDRRQKNISNPLTPKSMGEEIKDVNLLNNGDGISFADSKNILSGGVVNGVRNGYIQSRTPLNIPKGAKIFRTYDRLWQQEMSRNTAKRTIALDITLDQTGVTGKDERGVTVKIPLEGVVTKAKTPQDHEQVFRKLGNTIYRLSDFNSTLTKEDFIPLSVLTSLRRKLLECLDSANRMTLPVELRLKEDPNAKYPDGILDYRDNVANSLAEHFYRRHGVRKIERAMEVTGQVHKGDVLMTTRHCILRELGMCRKEKGPHPAEPLTLKSGPNKFRIEFDCQRCEMQLLSDQQSQRSV